MTEQNTKQTRSVTVAGEKDCDVMNFQGGVNDQLRGEVNHKSADTHEPTARNKTPMNRNNRQTFRTKMGQENTSS